MAIHLKRIVFFFCILYFGLGCCLGNRAEAVDPEPKNKVYGPGILNQYIH